jgi:hypothetical protein
LPIPFVDLGGDEHSGVAGFLRFVDEPGGNGVRGALFLMSTRGDPLEFGFTRVDVRGGVLWRAGEARRRSVTSLTKSLFEASSRVPDVVLVPADEAPPRVFSEDLEVRVPVCRVASGDWGPVAQSEEAQQLSTSLSLIWVNGLPAPDGNSARTIGLLSERQLLLEPFDRALLGLQEAFDS